MQRHCEERSDEAEPVIGPATSGRTRWLAMTNWHSKKPRHLRRGFEARQYDGNAGGSNQLIQSR
jgi:hypothetical protein